MQRQHDARETRLRASLTVRVSATATDDLGPARSGPEKVLGAGEAGARAEDLKGRRRAD